MNFPRDLGDHAGLANFHIVNVALIYYLTPGYQFQPLLPLSGGAVSWAHYFTVAKFLQQAHARLLTSSHSGSWRTLLHAFWEHPIVAVQPVHPHDLTETLRPLMEAHASWDAYVDGSWYPLASTAESLLGEAASHTGGCSIILVPSTTDLLSGHCSPCGCSGSHTCPRREPPYDGTHLDHLKPHTPPFPLHLHRKPKHHETTHGFPSYASDGPDRRWKYYKKGTSLFIGTGGIPSAGRRTAHSGPVRIGVSTWLTS